MISVIMPLYNEEKYLGYAIESVKKQNYCDWELIIINDASTDNSLEIAKEYAAQDVRIRIIDLQQNGGCCNALNIGIDNAKGEFICWLSSDDEYFENMMSDCMAEFDENKSVDAVIGRLSFFYQDTGREEKYYFDESFFERDPEKRDQPYKTLFLSGNAFNACSVLMRKEAVSRTGKFSEKHNYAGDYDFMMRLCACSEVICVNKEFVKSRVHSEQVTFENKNEIDAIQVFKEMLYNEQERESLLKRAKLSAGRKVILQAIRNRIEKYRSFGMEKESQLCEELLTNYYECDSRLKEADEYCNRIKYAINAGEFNKAVEIFNSMPNMVYAYGDDELLGILSSYIFLHYGDKEHEKSTLDSIYKINPSNYECNYLLAEYYAEEGKNIEAMQHYVNALKNSIGTDYSYILSRFKLFINTIGE